MERLSVFTLIGFVFAIGLAIQLPVWSESTLPPVDSDFIIWGLSHSATLLHSGKGKIKIYAANYFKDKVESGIGEDGLAFENVSERLFAFNGKRSYSRILFGRSKGITSVCDGRVTLTKRENELSFISVAQGWAQPPLSDPRDWGLWYKRQLLSDYLAKQEKVQVIGTESLNGTLCYVVQVPSSTIENSVDKFWIAPSKGFRCVRIQYEGTSTESIENETFIRNICDTTIEYQEFAISDEISAWFPKRGIIVVRRKSDGEQVSKNIMEITDFELNIDVSNLFDIQISPDTLVWDLAIRKQIPFKEIGWAEN